ncbi:hypothetical protein SeLEV6574_g00812 [Synchytrium endobioticum]|nr:hypothetical protein SeLEV6574_g00812 [Synchytrium endobioticum]
MPGRSRSSNCIARLVTTPDCQRHRGNHVQKGGSVPCSLSALDELSCSTIGTAAAQLWTQDEMNQMNRILLVDEIELNLLFTSPSNSNNNNKKKKGTTATFADEDPEARCLHLLLTAKDPLSVIQAVDEYLALDADVVISPAPAPPSPVRATSITPPPSSSSAASSPSTSTCCRPSSFRSASPSSSLDSIKTLNWRLQEALLQDFEKRVRSKAEAIIQEYRPCFPVPSNHSTILDDDLLYNMDLSGLALKNLALERACLEHLRKEMREFEAEEWAVEDDLVILDSTDKYLDECGMIIKRWQEIDRMKQLLAPFNRSYSASHDDNRARNFLDVRWHAVQKLAK